MGAFFLVIHSLVSTLVCGYVPTQPYFLSNNKAYSKLPIPFNDRLRISLSFLHFILILIVIVVLTHPQSAVARYKSNFSSLVFFGVPCVRRTSASTSLLCSSFLCSGFRGSLSPIAKSPRSLLLDSCRVGSTSF